MHSEQYEADCCGIMLIIHVAVGLPLLVVLVWSIVKALTAEAAAPAEEVLPLVSRVGPVPSPAPLSSKHHIRSVE